MSLMEVEQFYNPLDSILEDINLKCVRMDKEWKKACVRKAHMVTAILVSKMKDVDEVFKKLYSRIDFVGSYYDGLKVKEPTSFNMNLIMNLPLIYKYIEVEEDYNVPGFVKLSCSSALRRNDSSITDKVWRTFESWIDDDGYLAENKPRQWLESVLARTLPSIAVQLSALNEGYVVRLMKNGPAYTVRIFGDPDIDIILAFTIEFPSNISPPSSFRRHPEYDYPWIVGSDTVKKYLHGRYDNHWRISFPGTQKRIIHHRYKLKYILRFLKAFRDAQTNVVIPSHFFNNLFLWQMHGLSNRSIPERFWEKRTGYLYIYMMNQLYEALKLKSLKDYWMESVNLFRNHNLDHLQNMMGQLKNIILKINSLISYKKEEELKEYMFSLYSIED